LFQPAVGYFSGDFYDFFQFLSFHSPFFLKDDISGIYLFDFFYFSNNLYVDLDNKLDALQFTEEN